jgi:hypothetical protein
MRLNLRGRGVQNKWEEWWDEVLEVGESKKRGRSGGMRSWRWGSSK